jgi:hypothetical protein
MRKKQTHVSFIFFNSKDLAGGAIVSNPKSAVVYKGPGIS